MYTELTQEDRDTLKNENLNGTFICCDSPICHYCANKHTPDEDHTVEDCLNCIHSRSDAYTKPGCSLFEDNFIGIQCVTWRD